MPERRPYIAANWKMNKTVAETAPYVESLLRLLPDRLPAEVVLCVPFTSLDAAVEAADGSEVRVAAQNMHQAASGAFTGEVSAAMLLEARVDAVVLGHSERRQHFGETDEALREKLPAALDAGLEPIFCVGESEEERDGGETERRLRHQVTVGLERVDDERLAEVVIAYEPVWAIGTGRVATEDQAQEAIAFIRALVASRAPAAAERVRVLYGGSVTPDNAEPILAQPDVDGALVGGASLDPEAFARIVAALP